MSEEIFIVQVRLELNFEVVAPGCPYVKRDYEESGSLIGRRDLTDTAGMV